MDGGLYLHNIPHLDSPFINMAFSHISCLHDCFALCNRVLLFQTALHAQLLKPEMECLKGESNFGCMAAIKRR